MAMNEAARDAGAQRGWKTVALSAWNSSNANNVGLIAAGVAFYAFLALVPTIAAVVLIYGLAVDAETAARHIAGLAEMLPASAADLVAGQIESVASGRGDAQGFGLLVALSIALFGARNGAKSVVTALDIVYKVDEGRGFVKQNILALLITLAAALGGIGAMACLTLMAALSGLLPELPGRLVFLTNFASYAVMFLGGTLGAALLYRVAPDRIAPRWGALLPGAVLAAVGWTVLTVGFGIYVANFGNYNATYGSLGAIVVLLTWLYLSAYILLLGGELNAAIERSPGPE